MQEEDGKTTNYRVNNVNEYTEITGSQAFTPQYDANGNMVKDDVHTYRYDYNNKLIQVDDRTATYLYDALGRRIRKTTAEGTVNFFYAGDDVIEEQDGAKASLATYLVGNGIDDLIKMNRNGSDYFYHTNHLGSVMAITDRSGEIVERYEYDPFGKVSFYNGSGTALMKSAIGNEVLFTGRSYNTESGLYDYRARTMNPNIGRFVQVDPLLYVDGMNALRYVGNNSINRIDPNGQAAVLALVLNPGGATALVVGGLALAGVWTYNNAIQQEILPSPIDAINSTRDMRINPIKPIQTYSSLNMLGLQLMGSMIGRINGPYGPSGSSPYRPGSNGATSENKNVSIFSDAKKVEAVSGIGNGGDKNPCKNMTGFWKILCCLLNKNTPACDQGCQSN